MAAKRITLIHWSADEAALRRRALEWMGFRANVVSGGGGAALRAVGRDPPDGLLIDLSRIPSQGLAAAIFLRQQKATRQVPIVFVGGAPDKVERVRQHLPDAAFTDWDGVGRGLGRAIGRPPRSPIVPGTMAPYAGASVARRLGVTAGSILLLVCAPAGFESKLRPLPEGARIRRASQGRADLAVLFSHSQEELGRRWASATARIDEKGSLWVAWPKAASGVPSDLSLTRVRAFGLGQGWVDYKICSIDETWSGLRFARRGRRRN